MKTQKLILVAIAVVLPILTTAQVMFQNAYNFQTSTPTFNAVRQTSDGGYILAGGTASTNNHDGVFLMRTNSLGDTLWTRSFADSISGQNSCHAKAVVQTTDGGFFIGGFTEGLGSTTFDFYLIRTDSLGDTLWTRTLSHPSGANDYCYSALQASDGSFITFGRQGQFEVDYYLNKWNPNGTIQWSRYYSIPGNFDFGNSVDQTGDGGFILGGTTRTGTIYKVLIIKTDSTGTQQWAKQYGDSGTNECNRICQTTDGGYIMAGNTLNFGAGSQDFLVIKTDANGDTLWTRTFGSSNYEECNSIIQTTDGGYLLGGFTVSNASFISQLCLVKLDPSGNISWANTYGFNSSDAEGYDAIETSDGGYMICGRSYDFTGGAYVVKTDALGNSGCNEASVTLTAGFAPLPVTAVSPSGGNNSMVRLPPTSVGGGATINPLCLDNKIETQQAEIQIIAFPNPSTGKITLNTSALSALCLRVTLTNALGNTVLVKNINLPSKEVILDLSEFGNGIYLIHVEDDNGRFTQKLMLNR